MKRLFPSTFLLFGAAASLFIGVPPAHSDPLTPESEGFTGSVFGDSEDSTYQGELTILEEPSPLDSALTPTEGAVDIPTVELEAAADPFAGMSEELLIPETPYPRKHRITLDQGFRTDDLSTGFFSDELDLFELGIAADLHLSPILLRPSLDLGWGDDGEETLDLGIVAGYPIDLTVTGIQLTPLAGYGWSQQEDESGPSIYDLEWSGPRLGVELTVPFLDRWILTATYFYHWLDFEAEIASAPGLTSAFAGETDADGNQLGLRLTREIRERWELSLGTEYASWEGEGSGLTQLPESDSWSIHMGVSFRF